MKIVHIPGSFIVPVSGREQECVEQVAQAIFLALSMEVPGTVTRNKNTISFSRGYDVGYYTYWDRLIAFDPVLINIALGDRAVCVKYKLGLKRLYISIGFLSLCLPLLYYYGGTAAALVIAAMYFGLETPATTFSVYRTHNWLKRIAVNSVRYFFENDKVEAHAS